VVTAVIVAHDGAEWLPRVTEALLGQTRPVQRIVAVDTGSRDRSGTLLADLIGQDAVFGMDRATGYGAAVGRALQHRAALTPVPAGAGWGGHGDRGESAVTEWIWLIHDDCEPDPEALEALLGAAEETPACAVFGPKVLDWADHQVILEAGLAIDTAGRRVTGTEPREIDQGQHDGDRDVLAVSSAGMLARRDVWDEVGGFDTSLRLFREDVDFCWRVHAAGYRVRLVTNAVVYHLEASARSRRQISAVVRPHRVNRRNALIVLLANLPLSATIAAAAGNTGLSLARILFFLLAKRAEAAKDEAAAFGWLLSHPAYLIRARRRRRARGRRRAYGALRSQVPRGQSLRKLAEFVASTLYPSSRAEAAGAHHISDDPSDDDSLLTDSGLAQRILINPGVLLFTGLLLVALVAERSLLGSGPLGGGALLPAWGGSSGLWSEYLTGFHPVGVGSAASTPPWIAVLAAVSTVLLGKPWLAVDVILLGCVPLSGLGAYLASRRVSQHGLTRVWLAATYALLPVATGAIAAGRLGTAVVFILMPPIAAAAGRMFTTRGRQARRAAWATGLLVTIATAFVPFVWLLALIIAAFVGTAFARARRSIAENLAIVALVPPVLLAPWTLSVIEHPATLLLEAGLQRPGLADSNLTGRSMVLLNPGGPGTPQIWVAGGLVLTALAALLLRRRRSDVVAAWGIAVAGLLTAIGVSRFLVAPPGGGAAVTAWPGIALLFAAAGMLLAVASAESDVYALAAGGGLRRIGALALAVIAASTPVLAAVFWVVNGAAGPLTRVAAPVLPEFVSIASANGTHPRTLVLRPDGRSINYTVLRGSDPELGSDELSQPTSAVTALNRVVAALAAPDGTAAGDLGAELAQFDVGYVMLPAPVSQALARQIDGVAGLRPVSQTSGFELWKVTGPVGRVRLTESDGTQVTVPSGTTNVNSATAPQAGGTLVLAEPASKNWHATLNGQALTPLAQPVDGWAQGFHLPSGGGVLNISRDETGRIIVLSVELLLVLIVAVLGLPGAKETAPATEEARPRRASRARGEDTEPDTGEQAAAPAAGRRAARVRDRVQRPATPRRGGGNRGTRAQGRRRRSGPADSSERTEGYRPRRAAPAPDDWTAEEPATGTWGTDDSATSTWDAAGPGSDSWATDGPATSTWDAAGPGSDSWAAEEPVSGSRATDGPASGSWVTAGLANDSQATDGPTGGSWGADEPATSVWTPPGEPDGWVAPAAPATGGQTQYSLPGADAPAAESGWAEPPGESGWAGSGGPTWESDADQDWTPGGPAAANREADW